MYESVSRIDGGKLFHSLLRVQWWRMRSRQA